MAKVLAFDLGVTTGYCLLETVESTNPRESFSVLRHGTFTAVNAVSECFPLLKAQPELVVLERTASGEWGEQTEEMSRVNRFIHSIFREVHSIRPVDWKSGPWKGLSTTFYFKKGTVLTTHEKDAFRIAVYAIERMLPNVLSS